MEAARKVVPMLRRVLGAVLATAAAPFVFITISVLAIWAWEGFPRPYLGTGSFIPLLVFGLLPFIWFPISFLLILLISLGLGWAAETGGFRARLPYMLGGAMLGFGFMLWLSWSAASAGSRHNVSDLLAMPGIAAPAGALCGWIYWSMAINPAPRKYRNAGMLLLIALALVTALAALS